ncbi:MAG TPA: glycerophosphodiester phosphodiesterase family protein [Xanthobacteraceae bacterium]|nr:glycerophosphodiester phosphodiesterase family protein [Xanthobacteraceae bacterium]
MSDRTRGVARGPGSGSKPDLSWLTARPIAHRGLHDCAQGIVENTASAAAAAIAGNYGIEADLQISADDEAMVYHDDALGRLTDGAGALRDMPAAALKRVPFRATADRMMTLGDLLDLVAGRTTLVIELKSRFDSDLRLATRTAAVLARYHGPVAVMSFDPALIVALRRIAPHVVRGIAAGRRCPPLVWGYLSSAQRLELTFFLHGWKSRPAFLAFRVDDLAAIAPRAARLMVGLPLLTWTARAAQDRATAARFADQMIFEGFRP